MPAFTTSNPIAFVLVSLYWGLAAGTILVVFARSLALLKRRGFRYPRRKTSQTAVDVLLTLSAFASIIPWGVGIDVIDSPRSTGLILGLLIAVNIAGVVTPVLLMPKKFYETDRTG